MAVSPSHSAKKLTSAPGRNSSITTSAPASPKPPLEHHVDGVLGLAHGLGDDDALAGGKPVGLDDDRRALAADIGFARPRHW